MLAVIRSRWHLQLRLCFRLYCCYYDNLLYSLQTARPEGWELPKNYIAKTSRQAPASCCSVRGEDMTGFFHDYSVVQCTCNVQCACSAVVPLRTFTGYKQYGYVSITLFEKGVKRNTLVGNKRQSRDYSLECSDIFVVVVVFFMSLLFAHCIAEWWSCRYHLEQEGFSRKYLQNFGEFQL